MIMYSVLTYNILGYYTEFADGRFFRENKERLEDWKVTSVFLHYDPMKAFKTKGGTLYPLYVVAANIPKRYRSQKKFMEPIGFIPASSKKESMEGVHHILDAIKELGRVGFSCYNSYLCQWFRCYVQLVMTPTDTQAVAEMRNLKAPSLGSAACGFCDTPASEYGNFLAEAEVKTKQQLLVSVRKIEALNRQVDLFHSLRDRKQRIPLPLIGIVSRAEAAKKELGMHGDSPLNHIPGYDPVMGSGIDAMHNLSGCFKTHAIECLDSIVKSKAAENIDTVTAVDLVLAYSVTLMESMVSVGVYDTSKTSLLVSGFL